MSTGKTDLHFWQASSAKLLRTISTDDQIWGFAVSEDGKRLATGHESGAVRIWGVP